VPAYNARPDLPSRSIGIAHDLLQEILVLFLRHHYQQQEPSRGNSASGKVIARHVYSQPTDIVDRADYRIDVGGEDFLSDAGECHILTEDRAKEDIWVSGLLNEREHTSLEYIQRKL
jgi:hypothetical protein